MTDTEPTFGSNGADESHRKQAHANSSSGIVTVLLLLHRAGVALNG